jgi:type IV pilus assembly protein PilB
MATAAPGGSDRLGETLLRDGILSREQLTQALVEQKATRQRLGYILVKLGFVPEIEVTQVLARQYRMPAVDLSRFDVDPKILKLVPGDLAAKGVVLPL